MAGTGQLLLLAVGIKSACSPGGTSGIHDCLWYVALLFTIRRALPLLIVQSSCGIINNIAILSKVQRELRS